MTILSAAGLLTALALLSASAIGLTLGTASTALAQPIPQGEINSFDGYLDSHPEVGRKLAKDPTLIDNQNWVDRHPGLHEYLHNHPNARHEFKSHPYRFMHREDKMNH